MQFMNFMPHSAQEASQTQGIQNHQTWEHEEIQWNKRGEEDGGQQWVQLLNCSLPLVCSSRPPPPPPLKRKKKEKKREKSRARGVWRQQLVKYCFWMMWRSGEPQSALSSGDLHNQRVFRRGNTTLSLLSIQRAGEGKSCMLRLWIP